MTGRGNDGQCSRLAMYRQVIRFDARIERMCHTMVA